MQDKISDEDLKATTEKAEHLDSQRRFAETVIISTNHAADEFQAHLTALWGKYGLRPGVDRIDPDGTITRAEAAAEEAK